jgi:LPS-assembly protein
VRSHLALLGLSVVLSAPALAGPQTALPPAFRLPPPGTKGPEALPEGEIRVRADDQGWLGSDHWWGRGFVDVRLGDMRIQADRADVTKIVHPDGTTGHKLVAESNVVFLRREERLAGERLEVDDTGKGVFTNALGFVEPGVFVEGARIERLDDDTYRVHGGKFTACAQPNPRWAFSSSSARIEVGDKIIARNAVFKIKSVPAFYLPVVYYPIDESQRSTGFLFPHFGRSTTRGFNVGSGFFWAMGRSFDQTFYADHYSRFGWGLGHEFRYALDAPSRANLRTYAFRPKGGGDWDWDLDWNALQMLPGQWKATLNVRQYSDLLFQQQFHDNFNYATTRTKRSSFALQRSFGSDVFLASADQTDVYFGEDTRVDGHLPSVSLRRFPRKIGRSGLSLSYDVHGEKLKRGFAGEADSYWRFDLAPEVSRPLSASFLTITPRVQYRYTRYGTSYAPDAAGENALVGRPVNRGFAEAGIDVRGPTFSRVFDAPGGFYSDRFKHVIGPEITWLYRTRVEDSQIIPQFDGTDYLFGANQLTYAIVQRFLAKRPGPGGRNAPYEFLNWRVFQTYYVQIGDNQGDFDPNYSSSAFGPGFRAEHLSPVVSRVRLRPTPSFSVDQTLEYDVNFKQIRRASAFGNLTTPYVSFSGGWSRSVRLAERPEDRRVAANSLRGQATLQLVPNKLTASGSADYDLINKFFWNVQGRLRYDVQCCGFVAEVIRYNFNGRDEQQFRFAIELAHVGSVGNFMGYDADVRRGGLGGFR